MSKPTPGKEVRDLLEVFRVNHGITRQEALNQKFEEASNILGHLPESGDGASIGLALGFVQSGKTMSFTTLAAHAADNGFTVVIAFLGNTELLLKQNTERLLSDLRITGPSARSDYRWAHLPMPRANYNVDFLLDQADRTVLITTMKNRSRIDKISQMFEAAIQNRKIKCLIIDDEADQASLNTKVRMGEESATYKAINRLRKNFPSHLYIQYTATAFAPLLLEPVNDLSPKFLQILTPGTGYTGGQEFFISHRDDVVKTLKKDEAKDFEANGIPGGLQVAVDSFLVGSALMRSSDKAPDSASMLIHTSGFKVDHAHVKKIVENYLTPIRTRAFGGSDDLGWETIMSRMTVLKADFESNGATFVDFDVFERHFISVVKQTKTWAVNSDADQEQLDWGLSPYNILIGGNKLDRGFTVKSLTTSYMTRDASKSQADTVEQRARCYGYKAHYLEYCRFFAPQKVISAFTSLVHTEADLRASLIAWLDSDQPLDRWSVSEGLLLPDGLKPTRANVLTDLYQRSFTGWSWLSRPTFEAGFVRSNEQLVEDFGLNEAPVSQYGEVYLNSLTHVSISETLDDLLVPWITPTSPGWDRPLLIRAMRRLAEMEILNWLNVVYFQRRNAEGELVPRIRSYHHELKCFGLIPQGKNVGTNYPGDTNLFSEKTAVLQIHRVKPRDAKNETHVLGLFLPKSDGGIDKQILRGLLTEE